MIRIERRRVVAKATRCIKIQVHMYKQLFEEYLLKRDLILQYKPSNARLLNSKICFFCKLIGEGIEMLSQDYAYVMYG